MERLQQVLGHVRQALSQHPKLPHGDSLGMSRARALILMNALLFDIIPPLDISP